MANDNANVSRVVKPKTAVFRIYGSLAALVKESTWDMLLRGLTIGVIEPDEGVKDDQGNFVVFPKWSLMRHGQHVKTLTAPTMEKAVEKFAAHVPDFNKACVAMLEGKPDTDLWEVKPGFPNYINLTDDQIAEHRRAGMDAKKLANLMRDNIRRGHRMLALHDMLKEVQAHGSKREGRD